MEKIKPSLRMSEVAEMVSGLDTNSTAGLIRALAIEWAKKLNGEDAPCPICSFVKEY